METLTVANTMAVAMARQLSDGETVFHGVASPLPMVAILLAKKLYAPNLIYLNISGGINPHIEHLTKSTAAPDLFKGTRSLFSLADAFDLAARGRLDVAFLSGVQVDAQGRINMSAIGGSYEQPAVRLPGGAGSAALLPTARRTIIWRTRHDRKTFVEQADFVTAAGRVDRVVTPLCVFVRRAGKLAVESIHAYTTAIEVEANTDFAITVPDVITPPPTDQELAALAEIDPEQIRLVEF